ncbi:NDR1/HIN1-like protein 13 [Tasmannia lanceolata]|uniref:NDR1/HIN1-like protein 13 n=1 Tax=Tasmannia lanceolata TaxID=3420 RepID=UPI00406344C7
MEDPAKIPIPPLPRPPGRDRPNPAAPTTNNRRRVSFSEFPPIPKTPIKRQRRPCCSTCKCCMWTFFFFFSLLLFFTLIGSLLYAWARPMLPEFRVERLSVPKFELVTNSHQTYLKTEVHLFFEASNKNDKIGFSYDDIRVFVSSEDVNLGRESVPAFAQGPNNVTIVKIRSGVSNSLVDNGEGKRLKKKFEKKDLVLDVELRAAVRIFVGKWISNRFPITLLCEDIHLSKVAAGFEPVCHVSLMGIIFN